MCQFKVDASLCTKCGLCISDCPSNIIEYDINGLPAVSSAKEAFCIKCQHCLAICPVGAVSVLGKNPADSKQMSEISVPNFNQVEDFVRSRRSIRHYKDENVDHALIERILKSLAYAPTGCNAQELTFNVIDDKDVMHSFSEKLISALINAAANNKVKHPLIAPFVQLPKEAIRYMLFRSAPHALIVSAPKSIGSAGIDISVSLAYFEFLAQSAGLGTVWWGLLKLALETVPELKPILGIPDDHEYYAVLFGIPTVKFARITQKEDAAKVRRVTIK